MRFQHIFKTKFVTPNFQQKQAENPVRISYQNGRQVDFFSGAESGELVRRMMREVATVSVHKSVTGDVFPPPNSNVFQLSISAKVKGDGSKSREFTPPPLLLPLLFHPRLF